MRTLLAGLVLTLFTACNAPSTTTAATPTPPPPPGPKGEKPAVADQFPELAPVEVKITANGFEPATIPAKKGEKIAIAFTRTEEKTCGTEAVFDDLGGMEVKLPLNETVRVSFVVPRSGDIFFGCAMGRMIRGKIVATES